MGSSSKDKKKDKKEKSGSSKDKKKDKKDKDRHKESSGSAAGAESGSADGGAAASVAAAAAAGVAAGMAAMEKAQSERALAQPRAPPTGLGDYRSGLGSSATTVLPLAAPRHLVSSEALEGDCRRCMLALEGAIQGDLRAKRAALADAARAVEANMEEVSTEPAHALRLEHWLQRNKCSLAHASVGRCSLAQASVHRQRPSRHPVCR